MAAVHQDGECQPLTWVKPEGLLAQSGSANVFLQHQYDVRIVRLKLLPVRMSYFDCRLILPHLSKHPPLHKPPGMICVRFKGCRGEPCHGNVKIHLPPLKVHDAVEDFNMQLAAADRPDVLQHPGLEFFRYFQYKSTT